MTVESVLGSAGVPAASSSQQETGIHPSREGRGDPRRMNPSSAAGEGTSDAGEAGGRSSVRWIHDVRLEYQVDDESGRFVFKVYDKETGEFLRQVPPEEILEFARKMKQLAGMLISKIV